MSIKCGKCNGTHPTVADVRACYGAVVVTSRSVEAPVTTASHRGVVMDRLRRQAGLPTGEESQVDRYRRQEASRTDGDKAASMIEGHGTYGARMATDKMVKYVTDLLEQREVPAETASHYREAIKRDALTFGAARTFIDSYKDAPRKPVPAETVAAGGMPKVAPGHYAVENEGTLKFYVVDCPTEGRWAGRVFLSVMASDEKWPIKSAESKRVILAAISVNPAEAMARYGQEIGRCGRCHRTLTDATSRARGIGPDCWGLM
jgi:hypothetical protein